MLIKSFHHSDSHAYIITPVGGEIGYLGHGQRVLLSEQTERTMKHSVKKLYKESLGERAEQRITQRTN